MLVLEKNRIVDNRRVSFFIRLSEQVLMSIAGVSPSIVGFHIISGFANICYRRSQGFIL